MPLNKETKPKDIIKELKKNKVLESKSIEIDKMRHLKTTTMPLLAGALSMNKKEINT